jgi:hypothetical protein
MSDIEKSTIASSATAEALAKRAERKAAIKRKKKEIAERNFEGKRGRPKGSKNKLTLLREAVIAKSEHMVLDEWEGVVRTTLDLANQGDTTCLKILWDRVIPSKRAIDPNDSGDKKPVVQINISGLTVARNVDADLPATHDDITVDAEYEEIDDAYDE